MKTEITHERWVQANEGEKKFHDKHTVEFSLKHYENSFNWYFKYLDIQKDLNGKSVLEIGPAKCAGLLYCKNFSSAYVVEPTPYADTETLYREKNIKVIRELYEDSTPPFVDEVWILNLLQHVKAPDKIVAKAKESSKCIKFFEPLDMGTDNEHPHSFSLEDMKEYFGDSVQIYTPSGIPGFHGARCAYGTYIC
jgi:hypothetical protein